MVLVLLPVIAMGATACLGAPLDGAVATPPPPGQSGASRLPSLLQQLQGSNGAGLELFDGNQNQVLAAQDTQGKSATDPATPGVTQTVAGTRTVGTTTATPRPQGTAQTPRPATPTTQPGGDTTPDPTATPTATAAATITPTPTPTAVPTNEAATPTPTPAGPPTESNGNPPPEGG